MLRRVVVVCVMVAAATAAVIVILRLGGSDQPVGSAPLRDDFTGANGLITNEFAHWNPDRPDRVTSPLWEVTGGSLFRDDGTAWTGPLDTSAPDPNSSDGTGSAVFRMISRREFTDPSIRFGLRVDGHAMPPGSDADWAGVHVFLRYCDETDLYVATVFRRDGIVTIRRSCRGRGERRHLRHARRGTGSDRDGRMAHGGCVAHRPGWRRTADLGLHRWTTGAQCLGRRLGREDRSRTRPGRGLRADWTEFHLDDMDVPRTDPDQGSRECSLVSEKVTGPAPVGHHADRATPPEVPGALGECAVRAIR